MRITKKVKYLNQDQFFELYKKLIWDTAKGKRVKSDGKRIKQASIDGYNYTQNLLIDFCSKTQFELRLYVTTNLNAKETEQAKKYYKKFYMSFTDFLYNEKDLYDNYVSSVIKVIRTFFNYVSIELNINVGDFHKKFYTYKEEIPIVVLNPEQLNYLIRDKQLNAKLPEHLIKVKDIFIFGCTVALRYSDLMKLKSENIIFSNNAYYLKVTSTKTNTNTTIKLPDYALEILKKYHKQHKTLLPPHSNAWLNKCLKELAKHLSFNDKQEKYRSKRGVKHIVYKNKLKKEHYTMKDHITTHTMRRTAITTLLRLGIPDQVVRKLSGHAANSKEFFKYVEFAQEYVDEHTDKAFEKLNKIETQNNIFSS